MRMYTTTQITQDTSHHRGKKLAVRARHVTVSGGKNEMRARSANYININAGGPQLLENYTAQINIFRIRGSVASRLYWVAIASLRLLSVCPLPSPKCTTTSYIKRCGLGG